MVEGGAKDFHKLPSSGILLDRSLVWPHDERHPCPRGEDQTRTRRGSVDFLLYEKSRCYGAHIALGKPQWEISIWDSPVVSKTLSVDCSSLIELAKTLLSEQPQLSNI